MLYTYFKIKAAVISVGRNAIAKVTFRERYRKAFNFDYSCVDPENYPCNEEKYEVSDEPPTDEYLEDGAAEKGWNCTKSVGESCVKYTYFTRTEEPRAFNITRLCAKGESKKNKKN